MSDYQILTQEAHEKLDERLVLFEELKKHLDEMSEGDFNLADSLITQFTQELTLSKKQWFWVQKLSQRYSNVEPLYGNYNAILVMFRLAASNGGLKRPKIRLVSDRDRFIQLNFDPEETSRIKVYVDGWQGHGKRKYAGEIREGQLFPYDLECMTEDVRLKLQEFALDPAKVAKACAAKLGICSFCGSRLSDPESKSRGYGPVCAEHYGLIWGGYDHGKVIDLNALFNKEISS